MQTLKVKTLAKIINSTLMIGAAYITPGITSALADPIIVTDGQPSTVSNQTTDLIAAVGVGSDITANQMNVLTDTPSTDDFSVIAQDGGTISLNDSIIKVSADEIDAITTVRKSASFNATNVAIETTGKLAYGAQAYENSSLFINKGSITTTGEASIGAATSEENALLKTNDLKITTSGNGAHGILANMAGKAEVTGGTISTSGTGARGLYADGKGSSLTAENVAVETHGGVAYGVLSLNEGLVTVANSHIKTAGKGSLGFVARNNNAIADATNTTIETTGDVSSGAVALDGGKNTLHGGSITTAGMESHGIASQGENALITADNVTMTTHGQNAYGSISQSGGHTVINSGKIATTGVGGVGVVVRNAGSLAELTDLNIETQADASYGVAADEQGKATVQGGNIKTAGASSYGLSAKGTGTVMNADSVTIETSGETANGVVATAQGNMVIRNTSIKTAGLNALGVLSSGGGSATEAYDLTIETSGDRAYGASTMQGGKAVIHGGTITTSGIESNGIASANAGSMLTSDNVIIVTSGENGYGALFEKESRGTIQGGSISTTGLRGIGVAVRDANSVVETSDLSIETTGNDAYGIAAVNGGQAVVHGGKIKTHGENSFGLGATDSSLLTAENVGIETIGKLARSIEAENAEIILRNSDIVSRGEHAYAVHAKRGGHVDISDVKIATSGSWGYALTALDAGSRVDAERVSIETSGPTGAGVVATYQGSVSLKDSQITTHGDNAHTVVMYGGGNVSLSQSDLQTQGANVHSIHVSRDGSDGATGSADINTLSVTGGTLHSAQGDTLHSEGTALNATFNQVTNQHAGSGFLINAIDDRSGHSGTVNFTAQDSTLTGDIVAAGNNIVSAVLDKTTLTGAVKNGTSLTLNNGSIWNVADDSTLSQTLNNSGTIAFSAPSVGNFKTLTTDNYTGNGGTLVFNTILEGDNSATDRLVITGNSAGSSNVRVNNLGGKGAQTIEGIELISVGGQSDGVFTKAGRIAAGAYDYDLQKKDKNWYLTSNYVEPEKPVDPVTPVNPEVPTEPVTPTEPAKPVEPVQPAEPVNPDETAKPAEPTTPVNPADRVTPVEPVIPAQPGDKGNSGSSGSPKHVYRPETGSYATNLMAANTMFTLSLHERLGETQYTDVLTGEQSVTSLWLRNEGGHQKSKMAGGQNKTQANRYVVQLGGDLAQWTNDGLDRYHLGVMAGYANQKSHTRSSVTGYRSRGQINGYSTGLYGTWYANEADKSGFYVDSWAQYNWFKNKVNGEDLPVEKYKSRGFTASLESGYSFLLGETRTVENMVNSYWLQPQAQLIWMGVKDRKHTEENGTRVRGKGQNNIQTRLGMKAYLQGHRALDEGKSRTFQPFVAANWIHNTKKFGVSMDGISAKMEGTRNIGEVKTGVEGQISQSVNLWGEVAQQLGTDKYSDTQAAVGIKYIF